MTSQMITNFLNNSKYVVRNPLESKVAILEIIADFNEENKKINSIEFATFLEQNNLKIEKLDCCLFGVYKQDLIIHTTIKSSLFINNELFNEMWLLRPNEPNMIKMFNKLIEAPRRYKVYGKPYNFTGMKNNSINEIPSIIQPYLDYINNDAQKFLNCKYNYNSVLINWYEGDNYIGFHSDNEKHLQVGSSIYSISFGEERTMRFKNISTKENTDYIINSNEMIIMKRGCQQEYEHTILKSKKLTGKRINITIRCVE